MVPNEIEAARSQLERLLASGLFARTEQLSRLLRFLVEQHLEGRDGALKESVIGVEVFGRKPDYNPKFDPIVRTEARRLRARLTEYYQNGGSADSIRIDLPKGAYVPVIRPSIQSAIHVVAPVAVAEVATRAPRRWWRGIVIALAVLVLAIVGWTRLGPATRQSVANAEAYSLYLRGRTLLKRPALRGVEESIELFTQAISKDRSFAPGYAGIAAGLAAQSGFDQFTDVERADMLARGWTAAATAIRLDRRSADAQDALGMMQARTAQWAQAESTFRRSITLAPRDPLWREHFAVFLLLPLDRKEEAIAELIRALELDPNDRAAHSALVNPLRQQAGLRRRTPTA